MAGCKHDRRGEREPHAHGETNHENRLVDLDSAPENGIDDPPMVEPKRATGLIGQRPFKSWEDVEQIPGSDKGMVDDLRSGGGEIS